jgi:hypothetical protein
VKPREYTKWKVVLGLVLLVVSPIRIFSIPNTAEHIAFDLAAIGWWSLCVGCSAPKSNDDPNEMARWVP